MQVQFNSVFSARTWFRSRLGLLAIGIVLTLIVYFAVTAAIYFSEQKIAAKVEARWGNVEFEYCGPSWVPESIGRSAVIFNRIHVIILKDPTDPALLKEFSNLRGIESLSLINTEITDEGIGRLKNSSTLKRLYLSESKITDAALVHLGQMKNLQSIDLPGSAVSIDGRKWLQKQLPNCQIDPWLESIRRMNANNSSR